MPSLVAKVEDGSKGEIWGVQWMWFPVFLSQDAKLVKQVDLELNKLFSENSPPMPGVLDKTVINVVLRHYPMPGLREVLEAIQKTNPEMKLSVVEGGQS